MIKRNTLLDHFTGTYMRLITMTIQKQLKRDYMVFHWAMILNKYIHLKDIKSIKNLPHIVMVMTLTTRIENIYKYVNKLNWISHVIYNKWWAKLKIGKWRCVWLSADGELYWMCLSIGGGLYWLGECGCNCLGWALARSSTEFDEWCVYSRVLVCTITKISSSLPVNANNECEHMYRR